MHANLNYSESFIIIIITTFLAAAAGMDSASYLELHTFHLSPLLHTCFLFLPCFKCICPSTHHPSLPHTHTKRRPAESHGSFTLSAPNAHLSHSPVVFLHLKSPNILSPHSFIFPFSFFPLHPSFPSLLPVIHSSRMHPPLLISVAILRLLFLAGLFAEMTGLSLNLKHLISLHKARRLLYASTIR